MAWLGFKGSLDEALKGDENLKGLYEIPVKDRTAGTFLSSLVAGFGRWVGGPAGRFLNDQIGKASRDEPNKLFGPKSDLENDPMTKMSHILANWGSTEEEIPFSPPRASYQVWRPETLEKLMENMIQELKEQTKLIGVKPTGESLHSDIVDGKSLGINRNSADPLE